MAVNSKAYCLGQYSLYWYEHWTEGSGQGIGEGIGEGKGQREDKGQG